VLVWTRRRRKPLLLRTEGLCRGRGRVGVVGGRFFGGSWWWLDLPAPLDLMNICACLYSWGVCFACGCLMCVVLCCSVGDVAEEDDTSFFCEILLWLGDVVVW
jgi:hypothetical protein